MLVHTKKIRGGSLWLRRKLGSVHIRDAIARRRRAASIAALFVRGLRVGRRLRATVITRNVPRVQRDNSDRRCLIGRRVAGLGTTLQTLRRELLPGLGESPLRL
jgi:hypothetical protein